jgi:hypothetical protein
MSDERRKELMPEVLPAPTPRQSGTPRQRTLGHMNRLLAMAAGGAALAGCSKPVPREQGSTVVNVPQPKETATGDDKPPPPRASGSVMVPPTEPEVPPEPTGYAVVDPMPPPARCVGLASGIKVTAKWKSATTIEVDLGTPSMSGAQYVTTEAPQIWGATEKKKTVSAKRITLLVEVTSGTTGFSASVAATCSAGPQHVSISVTSPGGTALAKGTNPVVHLGDAW